MLVLTYYSTKWLSTKTNLTLRSKYISIVDRIMLGQSNFLAIAEIDGKFFLLGITEKGINILKELDNFKPSEGDILEKQADFNKILNKFLKK